MAFPTGSRRDSDNSPGLSVGSLSVSEETLAARVGVENRVGVLQNRAPGEVATPLLAGPTWKRIVLLSNQAKIESSI